MKKLTDTVMGFVVGDALGVPVKFMTREELDNSPVVNMRGYGTYNQRPGTWSDDTSMLLATIDQLNEDNGELNPVHARLHFELWLKKGLYTPYGTPFDVDNTTKKAITEKRGQGSFSDNGNGALMRMLPFAFINTDIETKLEYVLKYAALTHTHEISMKACELYVIRICNLLDCKEWSLSNNDLTRFSEDTHNLYYHMPGIHKLPRREISSSGYVVDTLEAALWCVETTSNYRDCVLAAVNLGDDTDTIAALAGGLAGTKYGLEAIPGDWLFKIPRLGFIKKLCENAEWAC